MWCFWCSELLALCRSLGDQGFGFPPLYAALHLQTLPFSSLSLKGRGSCWGSLSPCPITPVGLRNPPLHPGYLHPA